MPEGHFNVMFGEAGWYPGELSLAPLSQGPAVRSADAAAEPRVH